MNPASGKSFTLLMPNVDTICMNVFLEELAKEIKEDFILIMDGAGWHKSKDLIVPKNIPKNITKKYYQKILPKNIKIILLPPYCKELNPVERLWRFIKDNTIKNKVFETLKNLEDEVCEFIKNLTEEVVFGICK